jgi:hypothetical protein
MLVPRRRRYGASIEVTWDVLQQWLYPGAGVWLTPDPQIPDNVEISHVESHPSRETVTIYFRALVGPDEDNREIVAPFRIFELAQAQEPPRQEVLFPWSSVDQMDDAEIQRALRHETAGPRIEALVRRIYPLLPEPPPEPKTTEEPAPLRRFVEDDDDRS